MIDMATSSIFTEIVIDTPEAAERFVNALEESEKAVKEMEKRKKEHPEEFPESHIHIMTKEEVAEFFNKKYGRKE